METQRSGTILFLASFKLIMGILCENIPIRLNDHCLLNIVNSDGEKWSSYKNTNLWQHEKFIATFTHHNVQSLMLQVTNEELGSPLPLQQGYLRFASKQRSSYCILFILHTDNFEDTASAIYNSGFGTSTKVLFLVFLREHNFENIVYGFDNLLASNNISAPFHAPLIFFDDLNKSMYIYCYFCPYHRFSEVSLGDSVVNALNKYAQLNSQGYGRSIKIEAALGLPIYPDPYCFNTYKSDTDGLERLIKVLKLCPEIELIALSRIQGFLNVSLIIKGDELSSWEQNTYKWFTHLMFGESHFQNIATNIPESRSIVYMVRYDINEHVIACIKVADISSIDYSFLTTINYITWIVFLCIVLLYGFLWKNIFKGLDLMWNLFGIKCQLCHRRHFLFIFLPSMLLIYCSYQSCISMELMAISEFPNLQHFIQKSYTVGFPTWMSLVLKVISNSFPSNMHKIYRSYLGGKQMLQFMVAIIDIEEMKEVPFSQFLNYITEKKMMFSAVVDRGLGGGLTTVMGNSVWLLENKFLCRRYQLGDMLPINFRGSVRVWGYMSDRFVDFLNQFGESGILKKFENLNSVTKFKSSTYAVKLDSVMASGTPHALNMWSTVGMAAGFLFCFGTTLFLTHCVQILPTYLWAKISKARLNLRNWFIRIRYPHVRTIFVRALD